MKVMRIKRVVSSDDGSLGVLLDDRIPFALTCERPWLDNLKSKSCIPVGVYQCRRVNTPKHGIVFQVMNVPNRDSILFHRGNTIDDSEGCILIGEEFSSLNNKVAILRSQDGFNEFMDRLKMYDEFQLIITEI